MDSRLQSHGAGPSIPRAAPGLPGISVLEPPLEAVPALLGRRAQGCG